MTEFKQDDRCYLAVEVMQGAKNFRYFTKSKIIGYEANSIFGSKQVQLPKESNYFVIGIASELTEEQAKEMVDIAKCMTGNEYFDYQLKRYLFNITATESLKSRLTSLKLSDNVLIIQKL